MCKMPSKPFATMQLLQQPKCPSVGDKCTQSPARLTVLYILSRDARSLCKWTPMLSYCDKGKGILGTQSGPSIKPLSLMLLQPENERRNSPSPFVFKPVHQPHTGLFCPWLTVITKVFRKNGVALHALIRNDHQDMLLGRKRTTYIKCYPFCKMC